MLIPVGIKELAEAIGFHIVGILDGLLLARVILV